MNYVKAGAVLPEDLLKEIQKYVQGEMLYIPKTKDKRKKWGTQSGGRQELDERNRRIKSAFQHGCPIDELADTYSLSVETIKKIVYKKSLS